MSQLIILRVLSYDPAIRAGGAVSAHGEHVILRAEQARRVSGTHRNPILTDQPADVHLTIGRETHTRVAALVEREPHGLVATAWAVLPPVDWYDELIASGARGRYLGGYVEITTLTGQADGSGILTDLRIADGKLELFVDSPNGVHAGIVQHPLKLDTLELIMDAPAGCFGFRSSRRTFTLMVAVPATAAVH